MENNTFIRQVRERKDGVMTVTIDSKVKAHMNLKKGDFVKFTMEKLELK